ncbi:glycosyltransferase [Leptospira sp. 201903070]|uniref:Glycosyltransferase n=1 Tax=Leptospira ainlahdjerensis TaxID=2810033 RepID=A0ABS2UDR6_9LEPT|nr:glycosyltransferase [Leptospira ainlahdjerensis]MBM9578511.1 glycosyltransferase [Leptospira ainlahdjerensis]
MKTLSVIIPVQEGDSESEPLLRELPHLIPKDWEIIVSTSPEKGNRAKTLNEGVGKSQGEFLWFLHGDSQITSETISFLQNAIATFPNALHYYKLQFYPESLRMKINSNGANFRSWLLNSPFGDQGLCIRKETFLRLGGFDEKTPYGEDLLFVWTSQENGIRLHRINSFLRTSDRKYRKKGWWKITLLHQYLYWKLAFLHFFGKNEDSPKI